MLLNRPPPPASAKPPQRAIATIRLRNSYYGLHRPTGAEGVTESLVLGFTHRRDAEDFAVRLAHHRAVARCWPPRVMDTADSFGILGGMQGDIPDEEAEVHGLRVAVEPFQVLVRRLSLEGIALQLVTDVDTRFGRLASTVYREKVDAITVAVHLNGLLALPNDKH